MGHTKESFRKNALQIVIRYTCDLRHALCLSLFVVNNIQNITVSEYQKKMQVALRNAASEWKQTVDSKLDRNRVHK